MAVAAARKQVTQRGLLALTAWVVVMLCAAPLAASLSATLLAGRTGDALLRAEASLDACALPVAGSPAAVASACGGLALALGLRTGVIAVGLLALLLVLGHLLTARLLSLRPLLLARSYAVMFRVVIGGIVLLTALQALLLAGSASTLVAAALGPQEPALLDTSGLTALLDSALRTASTLWWPLLMAALVALLLAALLRLGRDARRVLEPRPLRLSGAQLAADELPALWKRVERLATALGVARPERIIAGLQPQVFVVAAPLFLRGSGALPDALTLYLPAAALGVLDAAELDAVIAHELAHYRGDDAEFSGRYLPAVSAFGRALDELATESPGRSAWARRTRAANLALLRGLTFGFGAAGGGTGRRRELDADRAAATATAPAALVGGLLKFTLLASQWRAFYAGVQALVRDGRSRSNLVADLRYRVALLAPKMVAARIEQPLLAARQPHPFDSHPALLERAQALGVDPRPAVAAALAAAAQPKATLGALAALEQRISAAEIAWLGLPGQVPTLDDGQRPPEVLLTAS